VQQCAWQSFDGVATDPSLVADHSLSNFPGCALGIVQGMQDACMQRQRSVLAGGVLDMKGSGQGHAWSSPAQAVQLVYSVIILLHLSYCT